MKYEIVVIADKVYRYPTTWANVKLSAHHVGQIHNKKTVNIYQNGEWFCTKFTNL